MRLVGLACLFLFVSCDFKSANEYFLESEKLSQQGKYQESILLLNRAIDKNPEYIGAYINRGADKSALGDYQESILDYKRVLEIDSSNTLALFNIGNNYKRLKDFKEAVHYYNEAFKTKGGRIYLDAIQNSFIQKDELDIAGHEIAYERGLAYYEIDSFQKVIEDMQICLKHNYMNKQTHFMLGLTYLSMGMKEDGCKNLEQSKALGDADAEEMLIRYCI
jgi:tetratricopeptide (TPR) repeat protein